MIERAAPIAADPEVAEPIRAAASPTSAARPRPVAPATALRLGQLVLQTKLMVGAADDPHEREADRVADRVVRTMRIRRSVPETERSLAAPTEAASADPAPADVGPADASRRSIRRSWSSSHVANDHHRCGHGRCTHPDHVRGSLALRVQRAPATIGLAGGAVDAGTERIMRSAMHGGRPMSDDVRAPMEDAFGADFGNVRLHVGSQATALSDRIQAEAFTTGQHIFFRGGLPDTSSNAGRHLLAHELTHTIQQGAAVARMIRPPRTTENLIQRHASWEHKMLGDIDPETLEIIAAGRDVAAEQAKRDSWFDSTRKTAKTITTESGTALDIDTVLHTIDQEIQRLKFFQAAPPTGTVAQATAALETLDSDRRKAQLDPALADGARAAAEQAIDDARWGVRLVSIPLLDGTTFLVTYGEMNTLADFYGSAADMARVPADNFRAIVGGVREESIRKFMRLRNELTSGTKIYDADSTDHDVAGAIGNKGTLNGAGVLSLALNADQYGELKLMGEVGDEQRQGIAGRADTSYTAGLARNACHFAPHSWHAWATAHQKAVDLALESWEAREEARRLGLQAAQLQVCVADDGSRAALEAEAESKLNLGLIENGFGDHFLQDSYAAGHLINKTLIMQWFAQWLDTKGRKRDYSSADEWRRVQQIAYGQPGVAGAGLANPATIGTTTSNDPQSVENLGGDWTDRFDALGLRVPGVLSDPNAAEFDLFTWWQGEAMQGRLLTTDYKVLLAQSPIRNKVQLQGCLKRLIDDGVVYYDSYSTKDRARGAEAIGLETLGYAKDLKLKREYVPDSAKANEFNAAVAAAKAGDTAAYDKMAQAVTYGDYHTFLNHGYLQLASNVLHDHFCQNGLEVAMAQGDAPYRIYGDNAMLGKESSKMVKYSAETAHRSRDSIYDLAMTGHTAHTTDSIAQRFPTWVRPKGAAQNISLATWHGNTGSLRTFCDKTIFPEVAGFFAKSTAVASGSLTPQVSKDATPAIHSGEAF